MTPPSTLRFGGIAATLVALVLMGVGRPDADRSREQADRTQFAYAVSQMADARAALAEAHRLAHVKAVAVGYDSVTAVLRLPAIPRVREPTTR